MKVTNIYLCSVLILSACATTTTAKLPDGIKLATESQVKECEFLGDVNGTSSLYGVYAKTGIENAKADAYKQALALKANTIVWIPNKTQYGGTSVHGNAYNCK